MHHRAEEGRPSLARIVQEAQKSQTWADAQRRNPRPLWRPPLRDVGFIAACAVIVVGIALGALALLVLLGVALAPAP